MLNRRWRRAGIAAALCCAGIAGCKKNDPANAPVKDDGEVVRYTVRGQVAGVPVEGDPKSDFRVRHEAIPEYRRTDGTLGMPTMTMPFPLEKGVSLEGIGVGDVVRVTFAVEYDPGFAKIRRYYTVKVEELPADTALDFSPTPRAH